LEDSSLHFRQFALSLERVIAKNKYAKASEEDVVATQKIQIENLTSLETQWREAVIAHRLGASAYKAFVFHILQERRNILAARPYFRERQPVFTASISPAFKQADYERLYPFHINWTFISFIMRTINWPKKSKVFLLAQQIKLARTELVELNLPLAISRSRIFWSRTPKGHLSFMDFISISTEGLLAAVDKFVLPYTPVFCSVAIGRMVGNLIENFSDTMLHFYPTDRRKIYRANKFLSKRVNDKNDWAAPGMVAAVNDGANTKQLTCENEISNLLAAATVLPIGNSKNQSENGSGGMECKVSTGHINSLESPEETRPDIATENSELLGALHMATRGLSVFEKKLLRMKGINV